MEKSGAKASVNSYFLCVAYHAEIADRTNSTFGSCRHTGKR
ncbi:hypothetical protein [Tenacibaculum sp. UWU-22]